MSQEHSGSEQIEKEIDERLSSQKKSHEGNYIKSQVKEVNVQHERIGGCMDNEAYLWQTKNLHSAEHCRALEGEIRRLKEARISNYGYHSLSNYNGAYDVMCRNYSEKVGMWQKRHSDLEQRCCNLEHQIESSKKVGGLGLACQSCSLTGCTHAYTEGFHSMRVNIDKYMNQKEEILLSENNRLKQQIVELQDIKEAHRHCGDQKYKISQLEEELRLKVLRIGELEGHQKLSEQRLFDSKAQSQELSNLQNKWIESERQSLQLKLQESQHRALDEQKQRHHYEEKCSKHEQTISAHLQKIACCQENSTIQNQKFLESEILVRQLENEIEGFVTKIQDLERKVQVNVEKYNTTKHHLEESGQNYHNLQEDFNAFQNQHSQCNKLAKLEMQESCSLYEEKIKAHLGEIDNCQEQKIMWKKKHLESEKRCHMLEHEVQSQRVKIQELEGFWHVYEEKYNANEQKISQQEQQFVLKIKDLRFSNAQLLTSHLSEIDHCKEEAAMWKKKYSDCEQHCHDLEHDIQKWQTKVHDLQQQEHFVYAMPRVNVATYGQRNCQQVVDCQWKRKYLDEAKTEKQCNICSLSSKQQGGCQHYETNQQLEEQLGKVENQLKISQTNKSKEEITKTCDF